MPPIGRVFGANRLVYAGMTLRSTRQCRTGEPSLDRRTQMAIPRIPRLDAARGTIRWQTPPTEWRRLAGDATAPPPPPKVLHLKLADVPVVFAPMCRQTHASRRCGSRSRGTSRRPGRGSPAAPHRRERRSTGGQLAVAVGVVRRVVVQVVARQVAVVEAVLRQRIDYRRVALQWHPDAEPV